MLSPNDITPRRRAASIWSFDSGYGSHTQDDDDSSPYLCSPAIGLLREKVMASSHNDNDNASVNHQVYPQSTQQTIGLGIDAFWNANAQNQLQLSKPEQSVNPITTKVHVFTGRPVLTSNFLVPSSSNGQNAYTTCTTCQSWNTTNLRHNITCPECHRSFIAPQLPHSRQRLSKSPVPRIEIPHQQQTQQHPKDLRMARCSACEVSTLIDPSNPAICLCCQSQTDTQSSQGPVLRRRVRRSCARRPAKLPAHALRCLQHWLQEHRSDPYPDAETKRALASQCGITERQVNTWFTNTRARRLNNNAVESSRRQSEDEVSCEPASSTVASTPISSNSLMYGYSTPFDSQPADASTSSTKASQPTSSGISRRGKKKDYGLMKAVSPIDEHPYPTYPSLATTIGMEKDSEQWQCTFCYHPVAPKSWRRHEETQHRPKRKWTCLLHGPRLIVPARFNAPSRCVFCPEENPTEEHFANSHRIYECMEKVEAHRTFLRPDHLRQHVRNFHKVNLDEMVRDSWRIDGPAKDEVENWTCGFCGQNLKTWDIRETHIAGHFKDGKTMADWNGTRPEDSPTDISKRRRDSNIASPSMMTKIARTQAEQLHHHTEHHHHQPMSAFDTTFDPLQTSMGPSVSLPLMPEMFDPFMTVMSGNTIDSFNPIGSSADDSFNAVVTSVDGHYLTQLDIPGNTYPAGDEGELDLDALTAAIFSRNPTEFTGPWDQQHE